MKRLNALVIGATGATGRELVNKLLIDDDFQQVTIFVRTAQSLYTLLALRMIAHCYCI